MERLPEHILNRVLSGLPLLDVLVLQRVCLRFQKLFRFRLKSVVLGEVELEFQFQQRRLAYPGSKKLFHNILENYGHLMEILKIVAPQPEIPERVIYPEGEEPEFFDIFESLDGSNCPNLVKLEMNKTEDWIGPVYRQGRNFGDTGLFNFPFGILLQFPKLKALHACLSDLGELDQTAALQIVDKMVNMDCIAFVRLGSKPPSTCCLSQLLRDKRVAGLRGLLIHRREEDSAKSMPVFQFHQQFPSLEKIIFEEYSCPAGFLGTMMPLSLRSLDLGKFYQPLEYKSKDWAVLAKFRHLTHFALDGNDTNIQSCDFLRHFDLLESISIANCPFKLKELACIPATAPLLSVTLVDSFLDLADVNFLLDMFREREYKLEKIDFRDLSEFESTTRGTFGEFCELVNCFSGTLEVIEIELLDGSAGQFFETVCDDLVARLRWLKLYDVNMTEDNCGVDGFLRRREAIISQTAGVVVVNQPPLMRLNLYIDNGLEFRRKLYAGARACVLFPNEWGI